MGYKFEDFKPVLSARHSSHGSGFLLINAVLAVVFFGFAMEIASRAVLGLVENWEASIVFFLLCGLCLFAFWEKGEEKPEPKGLKDRFLRVG